MESNNNTYGIDFQSKYCKQKEHNDCSNKWIGLGFTVTCICNCHKEIDKENIVLDEPCKPSNTHCRNHILNLRAAKTDD
jgi:hypothetical protein